MLQTLKCLLLFYANVLPGTHACVHVCAILRKPGVGVRSSGTSIDGWLWASMWILGTNPGFSARTSSAIKSFQLRQFKFDWLNCQSKDSMITLKGLLKAYDHDGKKNRIKTKKKYQSISPSLLNSNVYHACHVWETFPWSHQPVALTIFAYPLLYRSEPCEGVTKTPYLGLSAPKPLALSTLYNCGSLS